MLNDQVSVGIITFILEKLEIPESEHFLVKDNLEGFCERPSLSPSVEG